MVPSASMSIARLVAAIASGPLPGLPVGLGMRDCVTVVGAVGESDPHAVIKQMAPAATIRRGMTAISPETRAGMLHQISVCVQP
jgi:hypothetical protein